MATNHTGGVKSDETLFAVLECIGSKEGVRLTDIATELDMSKSTIHSHLASLREAGFVLKEDEQYHLGLRLFDYGIQARNRWEIFDAAEPKIEELAAKAGERTWCFVEHNHRIVYLCGASAENPVKTPHRVGRHTYLHHLAGGKAILAHLPESDVREILDDQGLPPVTDRTITDREELFEELAAIRERGMAHNRQEAMSGLRAIGAPIRDESGGVYGAISLSGPANRFTDNRIESELRELLLGTANEIELNLRQY
jgi:DNA-binding IclR family transcriptional regulator